MRICVAQILETTPRRILFRTSIGSAVGIWRGESPPVLDQYDIELEVPGELEWGQDIEHDGGTITCVRQIDGWSRLVGSVIDCDEHGVLSIDVGGSVVIVETSGPPPPGLVGTTVSVRTSALEVYPSML